METENKTVYLVYIEKGAEEYPEIIAVCSTQEIAEKEMKILKERVDFIKELYQSKYNRDYDTDYELISGDDLIEADEDRYDELVDSVYEFQMKYPELSIKSVYYQEKPLL